MKTNKKNSVVLLLFMISFMLNSKNLKAGNYTWNGATSTSWATSTNWTPNGVPGTNDSITIVTGANNVYLTSSLTVKQITVTSGTLDLQSYILTVSATGSFNSGNVNNGTLIVYGTSTQTFKGTQFGAKVKVTGNSILLNGSTFNDSLFVVKKGTSNDNGKGNNTFNGYVSLTDSASGNLVLSDSFPDIFNSSLIVNRRSTGNIYLAHRATGTQFNGDVTFNGGNGYSNYYGSATYSGNIILNGNVYFGYGGGSCVLSTGKNISIGASGISAGWLYFKNFTQQDSTSKVSLALTGTSQLFFEAGSIFNDSVTASAPLLYLNGSRFNGVAHLTNNGSTSVTSTGGCYFKKKASIYNSCSTSITYSFSTTAIDTFVTDALIQNNIGTLAFTKAVFLGAVTLKNANTTTGSDRYYVSSTGQTIFKGAVTIDNATSGMVFGNTSGTLTLDSTASLSFTSGFTGNITIKGVTQVGSSAQNFTFPSASSKLILGPGNTFNGPFTYYGHYIQLNGSTFNSTANITRYGTGNDICVGGNVFNGTTVLRDSSGHSNGFYLANVNGDDFNGDVTFIQKGTSVNIYPAYNASSTFSGSITVDGSSAMTFGQNGGQSEIDGNTISYLNKLGSANPIFKKMKIKKPSNSLILQTPISLTDSLVLNKGVICSDSINYITVNDNGIAIGGSDSSFINGQIKKIGNEVFTFPIGDTSQYLRGYHPITMSAPTATSDVFLAAYIPDSMPIGSLSLTGVDINNFEYWEVKHPVGSSSVKFTVGFNSNATFIWKTNTLQLYTFDGTNLVNLGNDSSTLGIIGDTLSVGFGSIFANTSISISNTTNYRFGIGNQAGTNAITTTYRSLYFDKFLDGTSANSLGNQAKENEFLQYCLDNNIKRINLYNTNIIWPSGGGDILTSTNPASGFTYKKDLTDFIDKAKNLFCIEQIAGVGGNSISRYQRMNDFTVANPGQGFDIFITESEFWNYPDVDAPSWPNFQNLIDNLVILRNNLDPDHPSSNFKIDVYTVLKDDPSQGITVASEAAYLDPKVDIISLTNYSRTGELPPANWNIVAYWAFLPGLAAFDVSSPATTIVPLLSFDHLSTHGVNEPGLGDWLDDYNVSTYTHSNPTHTIQQAEKNLLLSIPTQITNIVTPGVFNYFRYTEASHINNSYLPTFSRCSNNEVFYVTGSTITNPDLCATINIIEACKGTPLTFNYVSNYESGVSVDWDFGDDVLLTGPPGNQTHTYSAPGTYTVTSTLHFSTNCSYTFSRIIKIYGANITTALDPIEVCSGSGITLIASSGVTGATFSWSPGSLSGSSITVNPTTHTTYTVVASNANGCNTSSTLYVTVNPNPSVTFSPQVDLTCFGSNDGALTAVAAGGTSPYEYLWSNTETTALINGLSVGNYICTVTDDNGCTGSNDADIVEPTALTLSFTPTPALCNGGNGSSIASGVGGTSPYTYEWKNGTTVVSILANSGSLPAGSYTCEVTDDNGCTFTTTTSISAPSAISISFSTTSALCNGGNGSSTATPTGGTPFGSAPFYNFVWTDGSSTISTSESITNRPQGNYICTVTDANGCTFSASTTITEPTPLVVGSITTSSNTCNGTCNGSASVTPTGGTSPYTYVWNTNSSANTATISPVFSGTYSVLVSDNNGCTGSSSGAVTSTVTNCSATGILHLCNGETSSFVNSYHLYTNGMPVAIHEDFTVDQDFTFNASNVKIDPGVKITISANTTLTITNISILEACTGNWQGIVLSSSTSHLIIDQGSEIHDAINGADASNGAQVDATDAIFENNQVGIYLHDGNFSNSSVVESSFDGGSWTFTNGIKLSGVTAISINGGTNKNIFENLDVGIMCNATTATIQRCKFIGLEIPCGPSGFDCYAAQGSGIAATSDGGSSSITVGGSSTNKCEFIDCSKGVSCFFNVTLDAQFNEFLNSGYSNPNQSFGVFCMRSSGYNKTISNNIFEYMDFGISLASCDQENISIESNSFNNISPPPTLANERAITLWSTHLNDGGDRLIKNNLVKKYERGILVTNQTKRSGSTVAVDVTENSVYLDNPSHSDMWYGIRVQAGSDNSVTGNLISTTVTAVSGMEKTVYGISVEKSENNIISENSIVNLGTGIRFLGTGVRNTTSCNSLSGSYRQITMEVSFIDDQGTTSEASDNEWTRGTNTDANLCAIGTPASFKWYVQSSSTPYSPGTGTGEMRPIGYYSVVSGIDPSTQCTTPCTTPDCMQGQISKIVKEEGIYATFTPEELYNVKRFAYELLTKDTTLMYLSNGNDSILRVFYLALKEGNIDLLNKVKDYLQENDSSNAESTNSSLSPDNYSEENEKSFNSYYLESWAKYQINLDSTLKSNLGEIAYQNPLSGGLSVYGARAMLNLDLSDNYEEPLGRLKNPTQESISNELKGIQLGKIFPNPNSGKMFYSALRFPEKKGLLEFYDLLGTLVRSIVLYPDTKDLEIDLSDLPAGVYSYRIVLDNSFSSYDKIILQK